MDSHEDDEEFYATWAIPYNKARAQGNAISNYVIWLSTWTPTRMENLCWFLHLSRLERRFRLRQYHKFQTQQGRVR